MKTIEELMKEIEGSKELQEELKGAFKEKLEDFLKNHDCDGSAEEFVKLANSRYQGEIDDDNAAAAGGGFFWIW